MLTKEKILQQDLEWWIRIQENDEEALALMMRKYYSDLYSYGALFTCEETLIRKWIREVFISVWENRQSVNRIFSLRIYLLREVKRSVIQLQNSVDAIQRGPIVKYKNQGNIG